MSAGLLGLKRLLPREGFGRHVAVLAGGTAVAQLIAVGASPLLARLYGPEAYGLFAVFTSLLAVGTVVATWGYELAIPLPEDDETAYRLLAFSLASSGLTSLAALAAVAVAREPLARALAAPALAHGLWLLPACMAVAGGYKALSYWAMRRQAFGVLAETRLRQSIGQAGTQLGLGWLQLGAWGLLLGGLVGQAGGVGKLSASAWRERRLLDGPRGATAAAVRRYRGFALFATPAALLNVGNLQLPALALAAAYSPGVVGWFALGQRVVSLPMELVGEAVRKVFYAEAARAAAAEPAALEALFWRTARRLFLIGAGPMALLALTGPALCELAFGAGWREAGVYLQLLAPMFLAKFVAVPTDVLSVVERQRWTFTREALRLGIGLGAVAWIAGTAPSAVGAVAALGAAGVAAYGLYFMLSWAALRRFCAERP